MNTFITEVSQNNQSEAGQMENIVGRNIRRLRLHKDATQEAIASEVGISTSYLSHLEKGIRQADAELLFKLANVLGVSPQDFFSEEQKGPEQKGIEQNAQRVLMVQPDGTLIVSSDKILYADNGAVALLGGIESDDILGNKLKDFVKGEEPSTKAIQSREVSRLDGITTTLETIATETTYNGKPAKEVFFWKTLHHPVVAIASGETKDMARALVTDLLEVLNKYKDLLR